MTHLNKGKDFFNQFPLALRWGTVGVIALLLAYPLIYKFYQSSLDYKKRLSIPVRAEQMISAAIPQLTTETTAQLQIQSEVTNLPNAKDIQLQSKLKFDPAPIMDSIKMSFVYESLSNKVLAGAPYQQELMFFKSTLGSILEGVQLEFLEKSQYTGIGNFQELEMDLLVLSKKAKFPKKIFTETTPDQQQGWGNRIKKYLASLVRIEKNEDPQKEFILHVITDTFIQMQNRNLPEAIALMLSLHQSKLIDCTPWITKAQNFQGVLAELEVLYSLILQTLDANREKISRRIS